FSLRLNNRTVLTPQSAAQAAASLTRSPWSTPRSRGAAGGIGIGGISIPIGGQPAPGSPQDRRPPQQPRAPDADPPGSIERERDNPQEILIQTALPEGSHKGAVSGFVFFPFTGKTSSIKSLELEYGSATLKLK
ncbi:MAG TPA: hypothetical protein VGN17_18615, partial [Bryobacteraceae bacterium]